jgi:hypothetical protein
MNRFKYISNFKLLPLLAILCITHSCSDFLEQEPGTQTSITEQLKTKQGILVALNGIYSDLESNVRGERFAVYADLQGGNLKFSPSNISTIKGHIRVPFNIEAVYSFNDQSIESNFASFYNDSYNIINQTNLILEFTDKLTDATETDKNEIKAQALTIRGYTHFLLSLLYSQTYRYTDDASHLGIVYNTTSITSGISYPKRETVASTFSYIVNDLKSALENYSTSSPKAGPSYSYFNSVNTKALLARIYLTKSDWQNAYALADDVITNSDVSLVTSENYITQWEQTDLPLTETLLEFSVPKDAINNVGGSLANYFGYISETNYNRYVASQDLLILYEDSDLRKQLFLTQSLPALVNGSLKNVSYFFTKKFQDNPGYIGIRMSELYLIRAEAALNTGALEQSKNDVNTIRARAKASLLTTTTNLREAIFTERRKELNFEGHLFFDIARYKKNISRNDGCISLLCDLTYPSPKYVLPIPNNNLNLNANLLQNESY